LRDGAQLGAADVVLAVPAPDAARLLGRWSDSPLGQTLQRLVPAQVACLDVALARLPDPRYPVVFDLEEPRFLSVQSMFARVAPEGGAVIHAVKQLDPRAASDPHQDRADLERLLDRLQPGWREAVVERRFLPHMPGTSALPLASSGGLAGRPGYRADDIPNVYFAGDWVGPRGFLVDASLDSAREVAQHILRSSPQLGISLSRAA
jgi:phytoene dehydrogenase-like protein